MKKINLIEYADRLYLYLKEHGIKFNCHGFPVFPQEYLLTEIPDEILPFHHRNAAKDKSRTVICFYEEDDELYKILMNLDSVAEECSAYMGICGFDLSPCIFWDIRQQKFNLLLSQLVTLYIATKGIKVIPNFRIGNLETLPALLSYPKKSMFCVGSLGCSRKVSDFNMVQFRTKVFCSRPARLLYYGKILRPYLIFLQEEEVPYKVYMDFRTKSYLKTGENKK